MRFLFFVFLTSLFFVACNEQPEEVISYDDLKHTETKTDFKTDTTRQNSTGVEIDKRFVLSYSIDTLFGSGSWKKWDTLLYVQRFGPENLFTYRYITGKDSIELFQLDFADSLKTMNAFYNWLDCFGTNCTPLTIGGKYKNKGAGQILLVGTSQIISISGTSNLDVKRLIKALNPEIKKQNWNYVLVMPTRKNAEWLTVRQGEINKLKP